MVKLYPRLNSTHVDFINEQSIFYVATAPWAGDHINISPKANPSQNFCVLNSSTVAYLDLTGSGCETIAHVYENGRATIMFSSHGPSPTIMRIFGAARVIEKWDHHFQELRAKIQTENGDDVDMTGARAIVVLKIQKVHMSGGFSLPAFANGDHDQDAVAIVGKVLDENDDNDDRTPDTVDLQSLDGLPGLHSARQAVDQNVAVEDTKAWLRKVQRQQDAVALGMGLGMLLMIALSFVGVLHIEASFITHILNYQKRQIGHDEL
jgi:hypothetical protein